MDINDIIEKHTGNYARALDLVLKRANKSLQSLISDFQTKGGSLISDEKNMRMAIQMTDQLYATLNEAGYTKVAEKYRSDFTRILKEIDANNLMPLSMNFKPKDKAFLTALRDMQYSGMFRVESEIGNTIQRLATDYVLTERPLTELATELRTQLEERMKRYAMTHIETSTRYAVQKAEDKIIENAGIPEKDRYWEYVGPEDAKTRDECNWALSQQTFTNEERAEFEDTYGIRYNCRHRFTLIDKSDYERIKEAI